MKRTMNWIGLVAIVMIVLMTACTKTKQQPQQTQPAPTLAPAPRSRPAPEPTSAPQPVPATQPRPLPEPELVTPRTENMSFDAVKGLIGKFGKEDPYRKDFQADGRVVDKKGSSALDTFVKIGMENSYMEKLFNSMPILERRQLLKDAPGVVLPYVVEYAHPLQIKQWVVDLDWKRDIEPVDPDWYRDNENVKWPPSDWNKPVKIEGYQTISRTNLWVRMFWKRRGEAVFEAVKAAAKTELAKKKTS